MVGPAFGVDIGRTRFQTGVAFHMMGATLWGLGDDYEDDEIDNKLKYSAFGLALTPQFRFTADKRCSFILGCDFVFDFAVNITEDGEKIKPDNKFRFAASPYLGLGINFGK